MSDVAPGGGYRILSVLGRGGFGTVYRARFEGAGGFSKEVAIKVLNPELGDVEEMARRLRDEARMLGLLRHPAIVAVDRLAHLEGRWAVVMELVDGVDLKQLREATTLPLGVVLELGAEVAGALHAAWLTPGPSGRPLQVLHRDIKPGNILLTPYGEVKVLDFGVARAELDSREAQTGRFLMGSPQYMAPERLEGEEGPAGDVYSLGITLLEAMTGQTLGRTTPAPREHGVRLRNALVLLREELRGELALVADLLEVMLAHDPEDRPSARDCQEALAALAEHAGGVGLRRWARDALPPVLAQLRVSAASAAQEAGLTEHVLRDESAASPETSDSEPPDSPVERAGAATPFAPSETESDDDPDSEGELWDTPLFGGAPAGGEAALEDESPQLDAEPEGPQEPEQAEEPGEPEEPEEIFIGAGGSTRDEPPAPAPSPPAEERSRRSPPGADQASRSAAAAAARRDDLFLEPPPEPGPPWRIIALAVALGASIGVVGMLWLGSQPSDTPEPVEPALTTAPGAGLEAFETADGGGEATADGGADPDLDAPLVEEPAPAAPKAVDRRTGKPRRSQSADPSAAMPTVSAQAAPLRVHVTGDADEVYLVSQSRIYEIPGLVPPDAYTIEALFQGRGRVSAGQVTITADAPVTVHCSASQVACKSR